jgi:hypothetical protein
MKTLLLLTLISLNSLAEPYRVKSFDGSKGIATLDITVPEGWKISKTETEHGDYLLTKHKSVYFLGTYLLNQVNDKNKPLSLADFEQRRKNNNAIKTSIDGVDVYMVSRKDKEGKGISSYTFSRFISTGNAFHASVYPYPEFKTKTLEDEQKAIIKMIAEAAFPVE